MVQQAVHELELALKYFLYLKDSKDKTEHLAENEANHCQDLLSQATYHVKRAERLDEEEKLLRKKQEEERYILYS